MGQLEKLIDSADNVPPASPVDLKPVAIPVATFQTPDTIISNTLATPKLINIDSTLEAANDSNVRLLSTIEELTNMKELITGNKSGSTRLMHDLQGQAAGDAVAVLGVEATKTAVSLAPVARNAIRQAPAVISKVRNMGRPAPASGTVETPATTTTAGTAGTQATTTSGSTVNATTQELANATTEASNTAAVTTTRELAAATTAEAGTASVGSEAATAAKVFKYGGEWLGVAGAAFTAGAGYLQYREADKAGDGYRQATAVGGTTGALAAVVPAGFAAAATTTALGTIATAALTGTELGTVVPGLGNAIGFVGGLVVGGGIVLASMWGGSKISKAVAGSQMQASQDAKSKAQIDMEVAQYKAIQQKYSVFQDYGKAQTEVTAALATTDASRITAAQANFQKVSLQVQQFQGLDDKDKATLATIKGDLIKEYADQKYHELPDSDTAAKARQQQAMTSIQGAVNSVNQLVDADTKIKQQLTPANRQQLVTVNQQVQQLANKRIAEIHQVDAAHTQQSYRQQFTAAVAPVVPLIKKSGKDGKPDVVTQMADLNRKIGAGTKDGTLTGTDLDKAKAQLAALTLQRDKELKVITTAQAQLTKQKTKLTALEHDPNSKQFATQSLENIALLNAQLDQFKGQYTLPTQDVQVAEKPKDAGGMQRADNTDPPKTPPADQTIKSADLRLDGGDLMKKAVSQAQGATTTLAQAGTVETTPGQSSDPAKDKAAMDRALAAITTTTELQRA